MLSVLTSLAIAILMRFALLTRNFCRLVFCDSVLEFDTVLQIYPQVGERLESN